MDTHLDYLLEKAECGDPNAQFELGEMYYWGEGVSKNVEHALKWFKRADSLGVQAASRMRAIINERNEPDEIVDNIFRFNQVRVSLLEIEYQRYDDLTSDSIMINSDIPIGKSHWLLKSAEQTDGEAQYEIGIMYFRGKNVSLNFEQAIKWFNRAASLDCDKALFMLAHMYREGLGINKHDKNPLLQLERNLSPEQKYYIGYRYSSGDNLIKKDKHEATRWYKKAAKDGSIEAQFELGYGYLTDGHLKKARYWLEQAADSEHDSALFVLGTMYLIGRGVKSSYSMADEYFSRIKDPELLFQVAEMSVHHVDWYHKAASEGHARAQYEVGAMYYDGYNTPRDVTKALKWFERAAILGCTQAAFTLGYLYKMGKLVDIDENTAAGYFEMSNDVNGYYLLESPHNSGFIVNYESFTEALSAFEAFSKAGLSRLKRLEAEAAFSVPILIFLALITLPLLVGYYSIVGS